EGAGRTDMPGASSAASSRPASALRAACSVVGTETESDTFEDPGTITAKRRVVPRGRQTVEAGAAFAAVGVGRVVAARNGVRKSVRPVAGVSALARPFLPAPTRTRASRR